MADPIVPAPAPLLVTGKVQLSKPFYLSKKVWIAALGLAAALYTAITGKVETIEQLVMVVTRVAAILGMVIPLVLSIAHVDGKERDLVRAILDTAGTLNKPDDA